MKNYCVLWLMCIFYVSALTDLVLIQEARKRFDKASLLYDQVHLASEILKSFTIFILMH